MEQQLSLFSEEPSVESKKVKIGKIKSRDHTLLYQEIILEYIQQGLSIRQICEKLMDNHGASKERYVQGTPKIYPVIMKELRSLDTLKLVEVDRNGNGEFISILKIDGFSSIKDAKFVLLDPNIS